MSIVIIVFLLSSVLIDIFLIFFWYRRFIVYQKNKRKPKVSVLVAARNEEENIRKCLEALSGQRYPATAVEILVGDDASTDSTAEIVLEFPNVKIIPIKGNLGKALGKANVLAQLAHEAKGEYFLITDADIRPGRDWIASMISYVDDSVGIVNGITGIDNNLFQHYEWLYAQGMLKVVSDIYTPVTAIGNNMLITREAYFATGGYENINFSVTEDFALFREVMRKGFKTRHAVEPGTYATSAPRKSLGSLLNQRRRWMRGAVQLPPLIIVILALQGIYFPFLIVGLFVIPQITLLIFLIKLFLQAIFIKAVGDKLDIKLRGGFVFYELYHGFISMLTMVAHILPGRVEWKGRKY